MLTVVAAAAIGRSCLAGNKADVESGAIVVVGEYSIIELCIRVAIVMNFYSKDKRLSSTHQNNSLE